MISHVNVVLLLIFVVMAFLMKYNIFEVYNTTN